MAKGQMRSNRETRKPKKDKTAAAAPVAVGTQVKSIGSNASGSTKK
jgi:hypothetical protein